MGASQSDEKRTVTVENPNEIEITEAAFKSVMDAAPSPDQEQVPSSVPVQVRDGIVKTSRPYSEEEVKNLNLTAHLDKDYITWLKEVEKQNEGILRKAREECIQKADEVYERFSYVEGKPICPSAEKMLLRCYERNKNSSLNCSEEVQQYTDCVREAMLNYDIKEHTPKPKVKAKDK